MRSDPELILESHLENYKIDGWVTEHKFMEKRKFRFDFAWPSLMIAVEVEGGIYRGGRHTSFAGFTNDCSKYNEAAKIGWKVFRFTSKQVSDGEAIEFLRGVFNEYAISRRV